MKTIGAPHGGGELAPCFLVAATGKVSNLHMRIGKFYVPVIAVAIVRHCAGVVEIIYLLRISGDMISAIDSEQYDHALRASLEWTARDDIGEEGWLHASLGVRQGGLGFAQVLTQPLPL